MVNEREWVVEREREWVVKREGEWRVERERERVVERERERVVEKVRAICLWALVKQPLRHRPAKVLEEVSGAPPRNVAGLKHHCGGISFVCVRLFRLYLITIEERPTLS